MAVADVERDAFGRVLEPVERAVAGRLVAVGALGHAALGAAAALLFSVLLVGP